MASADLAKTLDRRYQTYFADRAAVPFAVRNGGGAPPSVLGSGEPAFTIVVSDPRGAKALAGLDQFQIGVAYLRGWLDIEGDLMAALKVRGMFHDRHPIAW